jgi:hypothetical protein
VGYDEVFRELLGVLYSKLNYRVDGHGHELIHDYVHRGDDGDVLLVLLLHNRNLYTYLFLLN